MLCDGGIGAAASGVLEQINVIILLKDDDGLFPFRGPANGTSATARFSLVVGGANFHDFDVINILDSQFYLGFVGLWMNLERVGTQRLRLMGALLGDQRPNNNLILVHHVCLMGGRGG